MGEVSAASVAIPAIGKGKEVRETLLSGKDPGKEFRIDAVHIGRKANAVQIVEALNKAYGRNDEHNGAVLQVRTGSPTQRKTAREIEVESFSLTHGGNLEVNTAQGETITMKKSLIIKQIQPRVADKEVAAVEKEIEAADNAVLKAQKKEQQKAVWQARFEGAKRTAYDNIVSRKGVPYDALDAVKLNTDGSLRIKTHLVKPENIEAVNTALERFGFIGADVNIALDSPQRSANDIWNGGVQNLERAQLTLWNAIQFKPKNDREPVFELPTLFKTSNASTIVIKKVNETAEIDTALLN